MIENNENASSIFETAEFVPIDLNWRKKYYRSSLIKRAIANILDNIIIGIPLAIPFIFLLILINDGLDSEIRNVNQGLQLEVQDINQEFQSEVQDVNQEFQSEVQDINQEFQSEIEEFKIKDILSNLSPTDSNELNLEIKKINSELELEITKFDLDYIESYYDIFDTEWQKDFDEIKDLNIKAIRNGDIKVLSKTDTKYSKLLNKVRKEIQNPKAIKALMESEKIQKAQIKALQKIQKAQIKALQKMQKAQIKILEEKTKIPEAKVAALKKVQKAEITAQEKIQKAQKKNQEKGQMAQKKRYEKIQKAQKKNEEKNKKNRRNIFWNELFGYLIVMIITFTIIAAMESSKYKGSVGKWIMKIEITDTYGEIITFKKSLWRNFIKTVLGLSYLLILPGLVQLYFYYKTKKLFQDMVSSTQIGVRMLPSARSGYNYRPMAPVMKKGDK